MKIKNHQNKNKKIKKKNQNIYHKNNDINQRLQAIRLEI